MSKRTEKHVEYKSDYHKRFIEVFRSLTQRYGRFQVWSDFVVMTACAIPASTMLSGTVDTVYVCYEENSVALYPDAGNVNRMFATTDIELAKEWAKRSIQNARTNDYLPYADEDYVEFMAGIGQEFASVWVYRGGNDDARENYGICVDAYSLGESKERLDQLFA